jgi:TetR/AcrR family transcriptional repressor of nem operon
MYSEEMDTAERLIQSTRELLSERGYVATSPKVILQRAGVGQGSMYHHFRGKADLALAAIERTTGELRAEVDRQLSGPAPPSSGSPPTCAGSATCSTAARSGG